ncbi:MULTISPECIES: hypothetical protein [unclassified Aurantimonas]|uniref:hypothetical protein n=1 Tax=unclassified Aurantimonas TaxID=2638230 RepID=UPI002E19D71E|nr:MULTISPECIES: hypothetical protein [unclassified Aurantimonas]MEC5289360.1 hypothetical protein [Aurantimonas sp. C2-3-R2]MEC5410440.1 hypothetical protein [Aurantimonas sp. C2-4-R8]
MNSMLDATLAIVLPLLGTVISIVAIPALISWLQANKVIKDEAQAKILQSALQNAAQTAIARAGGVSAVRTVASGAKGVALDAAVAYVKTSVPDAVRKLELNDGLIRDLVMPHVQRAIADGKE